MLHITDVKLLACSELSDVKLLAYSELSSVVFSLY